MVPHLSDELRPSTHLACLVISFACSGTPVQNNLGELVALLSFLMPAIFRSDVIETLLEFLGDAESLSTTGASSSSSSAAFQVGLVAWWEKSYLRFLGTVSHLVDISVRARWSALILKPLVTWELEALELRLAQHHWR